MLDGINKVHFVGIGGAGMSALAKILVEKGYDVSGSDVKESAMTGVLRELGARVFIGQRAENVHGAEAIVVSTAIREENPEVVEAKKLGLKRLHRSDVNAYLINNCKGIAVAGAHGKTTTTSMLGVALDYEGVSPSIIIGGEVDYLGSNARLGRSDYLVSEADESDGTFLKYYPYVGIVTNVENDHMDHYGTMENIISAFTQFLNQIRPDGFGVVCFDNENIRNIVKEVKARIISYAIDWEADYQAANIESSVDGTSFDVIHKGENLGRVKLHVPGRHNVLNAMAAVVTGLQLGLTVAQMAEGLSMFNGAKRRFQTKGRIDDIWVVDDYAHHPTEIATTIKAARQTQPKRLICAFQPHRYSRTQLLQKEYGSCFQGCDVLVLTDVYSAGEDKIPGIDGELLVREVKEQTGQQAVYIQDKNEIAAYLQSIARPGDLIMTMGAGDIVRCGETLVDLLQK
ncbi:UDP-N-acetylmuramate--L-alanine ligase [Anaerovibrio sp.]|uniref:UDP-N-acetylmuramate--L-alanine ligase n=1 Tax=Anaerovibrio sp. TaxID=1872532 RepID=UPI003F13CEF7